MIEPSRADWSEGVRRARAIEDESMRMDAFEGLLGVALPDSELHCVKVPACGPVDPAHYRPAPIVNFDLHLEAREYWPRAGRSGQLGPHTGYCFVVSGTPYALIGPRAIEEESPLLTRMHAEHELYHARHHAVPDSSRDDRELDAWTDAFLRYFPRLAHLRRRWQPWLEAYDGATDEARTRAEEQLERFIASESEFVVEALRAYVGRRRERDGESYLLVDLLTGLLRAGGDGTGGDG